MKYRYATWCRYCIGDDEGAVCDTAPEYSDETFDTLEEARQAAKDYCDGYGHLDYKVIDENYKEIKDER
jgi:hypothetical protein